MRQPGRPDDVAGRIHARDAGLVVGVSLDVTAGVELDLLAAGQHGGNADGHEQHVALQLDLLALRVLRGEAHAVGVGFRVLDLGAGQDADALFGETLLERGADLVVLDGQDTVHHFQHCHFGAKTVEEIRELDADGAGTENQHPFRLLGQDHRLTAADDGGAVEGQVRQRTGEGAGGNHHFAGFQRGFLAVRCLADDVLGVLQGTIAADVVNLVLLEQKLDAARELVGHAAAATDDLVPVEAQVVELHPEFGCPFVHQVKQFGVAKEGLRGDATPVQASAAGAFLFNARDLFAQLRRADGGDVARRAATDHNQVIRSHRGRTSHNWPLGKGIAPPVRNSPRTGGARVVVTQISTRLRCPLAERGATTDGVSLAPLTGGGESPGLFLGHDGACPSRVLRCSAAHTSISIGFSIIFRSVARNSAPMAPSTTR